MPADRLTLAHDLGEISLPPAGRVGFYTSCDGDLPSFLASNTVHVISPHWPMVARARKLGLTADAVDDGPFSATILRAARSRSATRLALGRAVAATDPGGPVYVDGQKTDGIDALLREVRARVAVEVRLVKNHGRLFSFAADAAVFQDWADLAETWPEAGGFHTAPGGFSADGPDPASVALADVLPARLPPRIADLGAGWGYLTSRILAHEGIETVDLVEAHYDAHAAAQRNISDTRARFHWADATVWHPATSVDAVVMNPPFHTGRAADPSLGQAFLASAARILNRNGQLWMVANRQLPYEATLDALFDEVETRPALSGFKIITARGPRRTARSTETRHRRHKGTVRDLFR